MYTKVDKRMTTTSNQFDNLPNSNDKQSEQ